MKDLLEAAQKEGKSEYEYLDSLFEKYDARRYLGGDDKDTGFEEIPSVSEKRVVFYDLDGRHALGPDDAPVTIVEFSDYHCPFCKVLQKTYQRIFEKYDGKVRRIFRHFPLEMHPGAKLAHISAECAGEQNKFWEYHSGIFNLPSGNLPAATYIQLAERTGLDREVFAACLADNNYGELVDYDMSVGISAGVRGTPSSFVNGIFISGALPYDSFVKMIDKMLEDAS